MKPIRLRKRTALQHLKKHLHWLAVTIPALLTWHLWHASQKNQQEILQYRFQKLSDRAINSLTSQLSAYENALRSARGFVYSNLGHPVGATEWRTFVDSMDLADQYLGMIGIGYISYVPQSQISHFLKQIHNDPNNAGFDLHPKGARSEYFIIRQIQPIGQNRAAWGYDIGTESERRKAAMLARDSGQMAITSKIELVQTKNAGVGFLLFLPIYKSREVPATLAERRNQLVGWVYSPLLMNRLMDDLLDTARSDVLYQIFDGSESSALSTLPILYDETAIRPEVAETSPRFTITQRIDIGQHSWTVRIQSTRNFEKKLTQRYESWSIVIAGAISILSIALTLLGLQRSRNHAGILARRLTSSLRRSRDRLLLARSIDRVLIGTSDPNEALRTILNKLGTHLKAERVEFWTSNESAASPIRHYFWTSPSHSAHTAKSALFEIMIQIGRQKKGIIKIYSSTVSSGDSQIITELESIGDRLAQFLHNKETEHVLKEHQEMMITSSKMSALGEMASGIAHEINNPLAIVHIRAEQIERIALQMSAQQQSGPPEAQKIIDGARNLKEMIERIAKIIKGLKSFARNGSQDPFARVSFCTVLEDVLPLCQEKLRNRQVKLELKIPHDLPTFECRIVPLSQVLINLISNAADAVQTLDEKWIRIECEVSENDMLIAVTDSGSGISKELESRIFEPFFTTKPVGQGTGLGLSVSVGIIRSHNGSLTLDRNSKNTRFVIRMPQKQKVVEPGSAA